MSKRRVIRWIGSGGWCQVWHVWPVCCIWPTWFGSGMLLKWWILQPPCKILKIRIMVKMNMMIKTKKNGKVTPLIILLTIRNFDGHPAAQMDSLLNNKELIWLQSTAWWLEKGRSSYLQLTRKQCFQKGKTMTSFNERRYWILKRRKGLKICTFPSGQESSSYTMDIWLETKF